MTDNVEQAKISIENNIKILTTLAERERKTLLARNKYSELEICKANIEARMETLQDLKYKVQEIMTKKDEEASDIDAYVCRTIRGENIEVSRYYIEFGESNSTVSR